MMNKHKIKITYLYEGKLLKAIIDSIDFTSLENVNENIKRIIQYTSGSLYFINDKNEEVIMDISWRNWLENIVECEILTYNPDMNNKGDE